MSFTCVFLTLYTCEFFPFLFLMLCLSSGHCTNRIIAAALGVTYSCDREFFRRFQPALFSFCVLVK